ncbi:uncharacterized protein LOC143056719 isoform X1 [Mytilus galloprovincialis]|uniref:uncharacterized protein LOC143049520 n=2 Tax=Mytilus galloprovincialis TaxID=29158 RepID=UPI003F7B9F7E
MNRLQRSHQPTVSSVLDRISNTLRGIKRQYSANTLEPEAAHRQVDEVLRNLTRLEGSDSLPDADLKRAIRSVKEFKENLPHHKETSEEPELNRYGQTIPNQFGKGRNQLDIDMTKFQQLLQLGFTVKQIAEDGLLGGVIHVNTLYRKLKENNIQIRSSFSNMPDDELQGLISDYNRDHPNAGALEVQAYLKTKGVNVQRQRCRDILGRVDPLGTATRWSCTIQRRQYSVPTANSVWHVDTHHSLIRWGIIVHGGIDGHSRLIPFLRASTFNTSKAAACFFVQGVKNYGVPSRIRADHGTEYADTGRFMISVNGEGRGSFMTGPSVHNQRIERLWRDIFIKVLDVFYKLFCLMEEQNILNTTNSIHRWVLQYVFVPRIDFALREWMNTHNNHKIRTEGNKTPNMMWFKSLLLGNPEKNTSIRNIENPPDERVDEVIQTLNLELNGTIFLKPRDNCPLIEDEFTELRNTIDITKYSVSHGLDVFRDVMLHVMSKQT